MALQYGTGIRNAQLDIVESQPGTAAVMRILSGAAPADCQGAQTGTVLATLTLPSDWMGAAASGTKAKAGTWQDLTADNTGTFGHFRILDAGTSVCHVQGSCGTAGDLVTDSASITAGQSFTVNTFTITAGNA
jgi:hypothetical protein